MYIIMYMIYYVYDFFDSTPYFNLLFSEKQRKLWNVSDIQTYYMLFLTMETVFTRMIDVLASSAL